ncbi:MAG: hypothetical protein ACKO37_07740 [Vampirovibrionales bacterium]
MMMINTSMSVSSNSANLRSIGTIGSQLPPIVQEIELRNQQLWEASQRKRQPNQNVAQGRTDASVVSDPSDTLPPAPVRTGYDTMFAETVTFPQPDNTDLVKVRLKQMGMAGAILPKDIEPSTKTYPQPSEASSQEVSESSNDSEPPTTTVDTRA